MRAAHPFVAHVALEVLADPSRLAPLEAIPRSSPRSFDHNLLHVVAHWSVLPRAWLSWRPPFVACEAGQSSRRRGRIATLPLRLPRGLELTTEAPAKIIIPV